MPTASDIVNNICLLLGQPQDTEITALASGAVDGEYAVSATDGMIALLNDAQNELARTILPIRDTATATLTSGATLPAYNAITTAAGRIVRVPLTISCGQYQLIQSRTGDLNTWYSAASGYPYDPVTKSPLAWADMTFAAQLSTSVPSSKTFTIDAFCLPKPLAALADNLDGSLDNEAQLMMGYWAAYQIAMMMSDVPDIASRAGMWVNFFNTKAKSMYERLLSNDISLGAIFPGLPMLQAQPILSASKQATI